MPAPFRLVIADDHALFRQGLKSMLRFEPDVAVVADIERASDLAPTLARTPCDVLLLDLQMERSSLADIGSLPRHVRVVVVTASEEPAQAVAALRAGARGIVFKRFAVETLVDAVRAVMEGHVWMPPALQAEVTALMSAPVKDPLSSREREIVRLVALGFRNSEVAAQLSIIEGTVKTHLNNVFQKLKIRDRVELTRHAIRAGMIGLDEKLP